MSTTVHPEDVVLPESGFVVLECEKVGCSNENTTTVSTSGDKTRVLCDDCAKEHLGVST